MDPSALCLPPRASENDIGYRARVLEAAYRFLASAPQHVREFGLIRLKSLHEQFAGVQVTGQRQQRDDPVRALEELLEATAFTAAEFGRAEALAEGLRDDGERHYLLACAALRAWGVQSGPDSRALQHLVAAVRADPGHPVYLSLFEELVQRMTAADAAHLRDLVAQRSALRGNLGMA